MYSATHKQTTYGAVRDREKYLLNYNQPSKSIISDIYHPRSFYNKNIT